MYLRGEMAEWLKATVSKIVILFLGYRGFKSLSLCQYYIYYIAFLFFVKVVTLFYLFFLTRNLNRKIPQCLLTI